MPGHHQGRRRRAGAVGVNAHGAYAAPALAHRHCSYPQGFANAGAGHLYVLPRHAGSFEHLGFPVGCPPGRVGPLYPASQALAARRFVGKIARITDEAAASDPALFIRQVKATIGTYVSLHGWPSSRPGTAWLCGGLVACRSQGSGAHWLYVVRYALPVLLRGRPQPCGTGGIAAHKPPSQPAPAPCRPYLSGWQCGGAAQPRVRGCANPPSQPCRIGRKASCYGWRVQRHVRPASAWPRHRCGQPILARAHYTGLYTPKQGVL